MRPSMARLRRKSSPGKRRPLSEPAKRAPYSEREAARLRLRLTWRSRPKRTPTRRQVVTGPARSSAAQTHRPRPIRATVGRPHPAGCGRSKSDGNANGRSRMLPSAWFNLAVMSVRALLGHPHDIDLDVRETSPVAHFPPTTRGAQTFRFWNRSRDGATAPPRSGLSRDPAAATARKVEAGNGPFGTHEPATLVLDPWNAHTQSSPGFSAKAGQVMRAMFRTKLFMAGCQCTKINAVC